MALIGQMKYLTIGGSTYEIPSTEVEVTQTLTSGTKIGEISVGSDSTNLYAPTPPVTSVNGSTGAVTIAVPTKTSQLTNDAGFITSDSDKKLEVAEVTNSAIYYPIVGSSTAAATRQYDTTGFKYTATNGTTSSTGWSQLTLGNSTSSGTTNNKQGQLTLYGTNNRSATISVAAPSTNIALALPTSAGTLALTSQIPTVPTNISSFTNDAGYITSYTDEKVKQVPLNGENSIRGLLFSDSNGGNEITSTIATSDKLKYTDYGTPKLYIYDSTGNHVSYWNYHALSLGNASNAYTTTLASSVPSSNIQISLPNKTGTIALTSDIPTVPTKTSDLTNDSGFITSDSDEKLKTTTDFNLSTLYNIVFGNGVNTAETKYHDSNLRYQSASALCYLKLGSSSKVGTLQLYRGNYYTEINASASLTASRTITFPDKAGTIALTSDIPTGTSTPTANSFAKYDGSSYLYSTTPTANDNSTKVATTAYVDAATTNAGAQVQIVRW